jgi:mycothiol system anti-sigma-R factor
MICGDVRRFAYVFLDEELSTERRAEFARHLEECPGCGDRVTIHRRLRAMVRRRLERQSAPSKLRERIHAALRGVPQPEMA